MTGNEIIEIVRTNYGDSVNNFLADADLQDWLDQALQDLYLLLPDNELRSLTSSDAVALTSGQGSIPSTWDRILSVSTSNGELVNAPSHMLQGFNQFGAYFEPDVPVYSIDANVISVLPTSISSVDVQHIDGPVEVADFAAEITQIPERYHGALADMVTASAYASEEDAEQYQLYSQRALNAIGFTRIPTPEDDR